MPELLQRLGDAITGTDRDAAYIQGLGERQELDYRSAQTDASMALARRRRMEAQRKQIETEAARRLQDAQLADPDNLPLADLTLADVGSSFSGAMLGRNRGQEYALRSAIADPAGDLGTRRASAQALSPASLADEVMAGGGGAASADLFSSIAPKDYTPESVEAFQQTGDFSVLEPRPGEGADPRTANQKNIDDLVERLNVTPETAAGVVYRLYPDPTEAYLELYRDIRRSNFASDEQADADARAVIERLYGPGALDPNRPLGGGIATLEPAAPVDPQGRPPLESFFR